MKQISSDTSLSVPQFDVAVVGGSEESRPIVAEARLANSFPMTDV